MNSYHLKNILSSLRNADTNYSLIDTGDRIVIGVSGGKDSLGLLYALSLYGRFAKKEFEIYPVLLNLGFKDEYDFTSLKEFVFSLGYELKIVDASFVYPALKAHTKEGKHLSCSLCSRMKKAAMKDVAKELRANKIAFAHHHDDLVETLMMNVLHGGKISTFTPKMVWEQEDITFIRPLIDVEEKELRGLVSDLNLPVFDLGCPANHQTERENIKTLLSDLYKISPEYRKNIAKSLLNYNSMELPFNYLETTCLDNNSYSLKQMTTLNDMRQSIISAKKPKENEIDFLILHNHKKIGEVSYRLVRNHIYEIFNVLGPKQAQIIAINELVRQISKKCIPATFILKGIRKDIAAETSFEKKKDYSLPGINYIRKTK